MPVVFQKMIYNSDLRRNPDVLYVMGDNLARKGRIGQAKEMRGERNTVGIATKAYPGMLAEDFFGEEPEQILAQKRVIDQDMKPLFAHVAKGGIVIWPADGIGVGYSNLPTCAPTTFDYLESKLAALIQVAELFKLGRTISLQKKLTEHE